MSHPLKKLNNYRKKINFFLLEFLTSPYFYRILTLPPDRGETIEDGEPHLFHTAQERLNKVASLAVQTKDYDINDIRPFYHPSERVADKVIYYIVPIHTLAMGRVVAHVDADTGQVIAFRSGRGLKYHVDRTKRGYIDPTLVDLVDEAISKL